MGSTCPRIHLLDDAHSNVINDLRCFSKIRKPSSLVCFQPSSLSEGNLPCDNLTRAGTHGEKTEEWEDHGDTKAPYWDLDTG
jgi:hypothetical protein